MDLTEQVALAERLAKEWMPGFRQSAPGQPARLAWEHPADLVRLLAKRPGEFSAAGQLIVCAMAWLHDVIEDGVKSDGTKVVVDDLCAYPFDPRIVEGVVQLTHPQGTSKTHYYETLAGIGYPAKIVKCVDRICNLREGKDVFKPARWKRYIEETHTYIRPLAQTLPDRTRDWLWYELDCAVAARKV